MKKLLAFDLDDTLAITKSPISDKMAETLSNILDHFEVCVISGGRFEQFRIQITERLHLSPQKLSRLHLMPTCGTQYYRYDDIDGEWKRQYAEMPSDEQKKRAISALEEAARSLNLWPENPAGEVIEDRESQITFSGLGQNATPEDKYAWDADGMKKLAIRDAVAPLVPDLEVRAGGTTSVDVTLIGIDKAYGMQKLIDVLDISKEEILFFGDMLQEGGNDYPVKAMGIDTLDVDKWEDTVHRLETILAVIKG